MNLICNALAIAVMAAAATVQAAPDQIIEVESKRLRPVHASAAELVTGWYAMSDDRRMRIEYRARKLVMTLDGEPVTELLLTSQPLAFQSSDGRVAMRFSAGWDGPASEVAVSLSRRPGLSADAGGRQLLSGR